jgi:hypothetical protein
MKVCDLAHQLVSGLLRIRGIEDWLRFAFACRHEASARIAVNFGGWRAAHAQGQSAKRSQFRPSMRNEAKIIGSSAARTSKTYRRPDMKLLRLAESAEIRGNILRKLY